MPASRGGRARQSEQGRHVVAIGVLSKEKCNARLRTARNRYCDCGNCVARSQSLNYHWLRCRRVTAPSLTVRVTYCYGRFKCLWFELSMLARISHTHCVGSVERS